MTTNIDLCNRALMRLGTQSAITSFDDGSVEASVCASFYDDVLQTLLVHPASMGGPVYTWQWPRCVGTGLTAPSSNPRWHYEIALPPDSVRVLRVDNTLTEKPTDRCNVLFEPRENFGEGMGKAGGPTLVPVLFTDHQKVSVTYITQSVDIDHWPPAFRRAFWLSVRVGYDDRQRPIHHTSNTLESGFNAGNSQPPSPAPEPYSPPIGPNGVTPTGLEPRDIADGSCLYIPADTPDGRIGILTIGQSPAGWRRPYHGVISDGLQDGTSEIDQ